MDYAQVQANKNRLEEARRSAPQKKRGPVNTARGIAKDIKQQTKQALDTMSLLKHLNPFMDWLFGVSLMFAVLKDISDFVGLGSLPVIGTLVTFFASSVIFISLFLTGSSSAKKKKAGSLLKNKYVIAAGGSFAEVFFGINFLPVETLIVVIVFYFTLQERQQAEEEQKNIPAQEAYA